MTRPSRAALLLPLAVLAACAGGSSGAGGGGAADGSTQQAEDHLQVEVDRGDGSPVERYSLTCGDPVAGDLPDAEAACAHLRGLDDPFAPLPADQMCTEQYGGPEEALVTGAWKGSKVDLTVRRTNGCEIAQWDSLLPLLPAPS